MNQTVPKAWLTNCAHCGAPLEVWRSLNQDLFCSPDCSLRFSADPSGGRAVPGATPEGIANYYNECGPPVADEVAEGLGGPPVLSPLEERVAALEERLKALELAGATEAKLFACRHCGAFRRASGLMGRPCFNCGGRQ